MTKEEQIREEIERLNRLFDNIPDNQRELVEGLIQNAGFMRVTLLELQREVLEHGAVIMCQSGNGFETIKDNPAQKSYTTMISRYTAIIDQLRKLLPAGDIEDDFEAFING